MFPSEISNDICSLVPHKERKCIVVEVNFKSVNVLSDQNIREGIKKFSEWPTVPQLYVKKEFVGGCDIVKEMFENGELKKLFENKQIKYKK